MPGKVVALGSCANDPVGLTSYLRARAPFVNCTDHNDMTVLDSCTTRDQEAYFWYVSRLRNDILPSEGQIDVSNIQLFHYPGLSTSTPAS